VVFKKPILFGTELQLKEGHLYLLAMSKDDRKNIGLKPKIVYWIYTTVVQPILTYAALPVVEKSVTNKCHSKNSTPARSYLCKHNREHAFYSNCSSGGHTDVANSWYLY
jgi:hypothetical protein